MDPETAQIMDILFKNRNKSFVKRIIDRDKYPVLQNPNGSISTHSMAWGENDGRYYVYPTVILGGENKLKRLSEDEAWNNAMNTGQYIEFDNPNTADWFSRNYKKVWNLRQ